MAKLTFFADECVFGNTVSLLQDLGKDVVRAQEMEMAGASDEEIYDKAQKLEAVLITNDHGFGDIRSYPPSTHNGIILLKMLPDLKAIDEVHTVLRLLLTRESEFSGTLFIVDRDKYRKRTKP